MICLAPIDGATDAAFRTIVHELGAADRYFTEFYRAEHVSAERLAPEVRAVVKMPTYLQLWGNEPGAYERASRCAQEAGFRGIDINLGCAVPKMVRKGYCAALMQRPDLVTRIVAACRSGAPQLPVSVKTRLAATTEESVAWFSHLAALDLEAVTIHFRRVSWDYRAAADWGNAGVYAAPLHDRGTLVIGNGDLKSRAAAEGAAHAYGLDGAMVGRAVVNNPAALKATGLAAADPATGDIRRRSYCERADLLRRHITLHREYLGSGAFARMKRFFKVYLFDDTATVEELYRATDHAEALASLRTRAVAFPHEKTCEAS